MTESFVYHNPKKYIFRNIKAFKTSQSKFGWIFLYFLVIYLIQIGKLFFIAINGSRPQNLGPIYEALANAGDVG